MASKRSWKTTLSGIFGLTMTAAAIFHNPGIIMDPATSPLVLGGIAASIGNILAKDASIVSDKLPTPAELATGVDVAKQIKDIVDRRKAGS